MLAFLALTGCQLLVDDVPFPSCVDIDPQCVESSRERGSGSCVDYRCDAESGRCLPFGEGEENCDGYDNDCDGVIDEADTAPTFAADPSEEIAALDGLIERHRLRYGVDADGLDVLALQADDAMRRVPSLIRLSRTARDVRSLVLRSSTEVDEIDLVGGLTAACLRVPLSECADGACALDPTGCAFLDSVATGPATGLAGAILEPTVTAAASLQVGTLAIDDPGAELAFRGPPYLSNVFGGARSDGACADCAPSLAAIEAFATSEGGIDRTVGLLAAIGSAGVVGECPAPTPVPIEVLSLFVDRDAERPDSPWIAGSNGGVLERLGETTAMGPPAIDGIGPSSTTVPEGFVVAYADAVELRVHFIARPPFARIDPTCTACSEPTATPPLAPRAAPDASIPAPNAGFVAIAAAAPRPGRVGDGRLHVLVVWAEGCVAAGPQRVAARMIVLDFGAATPTATLGAELLLTSDGALDSPPAVLYRDSGFLRAGTQRDGAMVGEDDDGGFYVAYSGASGARLARIRELDGALLDESALDVGEARSLALYGATDPDDELALVYEDGDRLARARLCR